jgi:hypothetical protein
VSLINKAAKSVVTFPSISITALGATSFVPSADKMNPQNKKRTMGSIFNLMFWLVYCAYSLSETALHNGFQ